MKKIYPLLTILCAFAFSSAALADPPTVVGRLSLIEGSASIRHSYDQQWTPGGVNYPVIAGDGVWSDQDSRVEVEIGAAEARLDEASELDIDRLDDGGAAFRVPQGVLNLVVRYVPPGGIQLLTSVGQLSIQRPGEYHIDSGRPNGPPTQLLLGVLTGEAAFSGQRGVVDLRSGQGVMLPPDQSNMTVVALYPTPFDQWAENRAGQLAASQTLSYVSPEMTGYQDLDGYGSWQPVPDYGMVWFPTRVDIGWAPYRYGRWEYVRPWGWTWIDAAPWGFAPFHYGRWAMFDGRWAWIPGERHERPCYAPALVAFFGGEPGEHMEGGIGWVPLGPHEVFHPYYAHSDTYIFVVNRAHFHDEHDFRDHEARWHPQEATVNNFANRQAVTNVNATTFTGHQPVHQNMVQQPASRGAAPVVSDFNRLPQQQQQPVQAGPRPGPQQQPAQFQQQPGPHPTAPQQPAQLQPQQHPQPQTPAPQAQPAFQQPHPAPVPQPQPIPQQSPPYHPQPQPQPQPQPAQQYQQPAQQYHPQPVQQPQPQQSHPQPQPSQRQEEKDQKHDPH